jgi:glycosyltransferase involved in cell wall biosynthesis
MGVKRHRIHLLPNVIDLARFTQAPRQANGHVNLCFVGRLAPQKRVDVLLQALGKAKEATGDLLAATIVGDGPERGRLEKLASDLQLLGHGVTFAGNCEDPRVYYRDADLLALTSDFEGTPNVLLEAMASGLPVVATSVGGVPDLVQSGETGLLCEAGNVDAVAEQIVRLAGDVELRRRVGANAAAFIAEHYSCDALAGNLLRVYEAALR